MFNKQANADSGYYNSIVDESEKCLWRNDLYVAYTEQSVLIRFSKGNNSPRRRSNDVRFRPSM